MSNITITSPNVNTTVEITSEAEAAVGFDAVTRNPISANLKLLMAAFLSECSRIQGGVPPVVPPVAGGPTTPPLPGTVKPVDHTVLVLSILNAAVAAAEADAV